MPVLPPTLASTIASRVVGTLMKVGTPPFVTTGCKTAYVAYNAAAQVNE